MRTEIFRGLARAARPFALPVAAACVAAALAGCSHPAASKAAISTSTMPQNVTLTRAQLQHLRLYTVASASYRRTLDTTGIVAFDDNQSTSVLAPLSGPVTRLLANAGDLVKQGQPLAVVASPDFASAISDYRKALASARTARKLAGQDQDLLRHQGVSEREAEQAQTDAANAGADVEAARQALVALHVNPKDIRALQGGQTVAALEGTIRAPIAGTVVDRSITVGQLLQAGSTPCFTIADLSRMWVKAQVFGSELAAVKVGDPALVDIGNGARPIAGKVSYVGAQVDPDTRSVTARVQVDNPGGVLKGAMYVGVQIQSGQPAQGLQVPVTAILRDYDDLPFVYVDQPDGSFARRHVTLGYRAGSQVVIAEGLRAGERVVVDGSIFLRFMQTQ